ncbi:MAG TPA: 50S ribosomal protein L11 methyltransferase [Minicystis sp.]|nr:50S ribosomal protein L11 methyltransferase [Minicystis sp.]
MSDARGASTPADEARYPFVAVDIDADAADDLSAELFDLGATGVEVRDDQTLLRGPGGGRVTLVGSFGARDEADDAIRELGARGLAARLEEVVGDAWRDAWKAHFSPFSLTQAITVVPPWVAYTPSRPGEKVLELEPGRAFGTGLHATTSLVAEALDARADALVGQSVLDVGTGSGILALAALLYGAARAVAIDVDAEVIPVVRENAARSGLAARVDARAAPIESITESFPFVLANIEARVLGPMAPELARVVAPGGVLVLSGVLASEKASMIARYTSLSRVLVLADARERGDAAGDAWVALTFIAAP